MRRIEIVWKRVLQDGDTCERCNATGAAVEEAIGLLARDPETADVHVRSTQEALTLARLGESNGVFINGVSIESLLGAQALETHCQSCCEMIGTDVDCRAIRVDDAVYEALPARLILKAMRASLGLD